MSTDSAQRAGEEVVRELRAALGRAHELLQEIEENGDAAPPAAADLSEHEGLKERLERAEADLSEISQQLINAENQRSRLMNLYVATYQLHATLDVQEVTSTISEIARDLLGAEQYLLLLGTEDGDENVCEVSMAAGLDGVEPSFLNGGLYRGGDPGIDRTLGDGVLRMEQEPGSAALAVVPLQVQGEIVGALVILKLFDHKPCLTPQDRDLLDLLAAHAASALLAARVYSATDRRLKSLESLVQLVK